MVVDYSFPGERKKERLELEGVGMDGRMDGWEG